jgi:hypothetical protein
MSNKADITAHTVLLIGIDMLDQVYWHLPADQQALPHIREAMAALDALEQAVMSSLARVSRWQASDLSVPSSDLMEWALCKLMSAWRSAPDEHSQMALIGDLKQRCGRDRRIAEAWKKRRAAKRGRQNARR